MLRAVCCAAPSFCLIGLLGLGLGAIIRHTARGRRRAGRRRVLVAPIIGAVAHALLGYMPISIIGNSLTTTKPSCGGAGPCPHFLSPWAGLAVLCLYAAVALAIGGWLLVSRDA